MPHLSKQDLDSIFREGAQSQEFEYNEAAWLQLESRLDKQDRKRRLIIWFSVMLGFFVTGFILAFILKDNSQEPEFQNQDNIVVEMELSPLLAKDVDSNNENNSVLISTDPLSIVDKDLDVNTENKSETSNNKQVISKAKVLTENIDLNTTLIVSEINVDQKENLAVSNKTLEKKVKEIYQAEDISTIKIASIKSNEVIQVVDLDIAYVKSFISNDVEISNRYTFGLHGNLEWSAVKTHLSSKTGWKIGARIGYQFANHWELTTGIALSRKFFDGQGSDYQVSEGFWVDNIIPMTMDAKCDIIEIPLDVQYFSNTFSQSGLTLGLGFRSFMLHSEWYGFEYDPSIPNQQNLIKEQVMQDKNNNWVGAVQLSVGYQKIYKNTAIHFAPYIQIPITGIGEGKVNLFATGIQLTASIFTR